MRAHPRQAVLCVSMATPVTCYFEAEASRGLELLSNVQVRVETSSLEYIERLMNYHSLFLLSTRGNTIQKF